MKRTYTTPSLRSYELCTDSVILTASISVNGEHTTEEQYSSSWAFDEAFENSELNEE